MTAKEIIEASKHIPVNSYFPAMEIAKEFHDARLVYVPGGDLSVGFFQMVAAIWHGGYMAGVQAERKRQRSKDN